MKKLVSVALCGVAAAAFALPAAAADEAGAKNRAGSNASVEGGAALGSTGVNTRSPGDQPRTGDNAGAGARTGDAQARNDNKTEDSSVQAPGSERKAKAKTRAQRKEERDASSGVTGKTY
jgi:hypothetical protein